MTVQYEVQGSGSRQLPAMSISGGATIYEAMISGITANSTYSIKVAAVNSAGTGVYNSTTAVSTSGEV